MSQAHEARRAGDAAGVRNVNFLAGVNFRGFSAKPYAVQAARSGVMRRVDFGAINRAALAALPAILARLLPGKVIAGEYVALNPTRADRRPGSFKINLRSGRWADFARQIAAAILSLALGYCDTLEMNFGSWRVVGAVPFRPPSPHPGRLDRSRRNGRRNTASRRRPYSRRPHARTFRTHSRAPPSRAHRIS